MQHFNYWYVKGQSILSLLLHFLMNVLWQPDERNLICRLEKVICTSL